MKEESIERLERIAIFIAVLLSLLVLRSIGIWLHTASAFLLPFIVAVFLMFIINPVIAFFEKRKIPGPLAVLFSVLLFVLIFVLIGMVIKNNIDAFAREFPKYEQRIDTLTRDIIELLQIKGQQGTGESGQLPAGLLATLEKFSVSDAITALVSSIGNFLSNAVLVLLFLLFLLTGRNTLIPKIKRAFSETTSAKIASVFRNIDRQVQKYLQIKTIISSLTGALALIVLYLFGVDFAGIWALLTFLLNFIPSIGSLIATVLPVSVALIQFDSYARVAGLALCLFVVQFSMGNILEPRILGRQVNLSPVVLMVALLYWGWQWGIIGMLLAVPLTVMFKIICENVPPLRFLGILMSSGVPDPDEKTAKT
jgi:predicted PurR-regulated permease PerM